LNIRVHAAEKLSLEQIRLLVAASEGLRFESENHRQMYAWVESVPIERQFKQQGKVANSSTAYSVHHEPTGGGNDGS